MPVQYIQYSIHRYGSTPPSPVLWWWWWWRWWRRRGRRRRRRRRRTGRRWLRLGRGSPASPFTAASLACARVGWIGSAAAGALPRSALTARRTSRQGGLVQECARAALPVSLGQWARQHCVGNGGAERRAALAAAHILLLRRCRALRLQQRCAGGTVDLEHLCRARCSSRLEAARVPCGPPHTFRKYQLSGSLY